MKLLFLLVLFLTSMGFGDEKLPGFTFRKGKIWAGPSTYRFEKSMCEVRYGHNKERCEQGYDVKNLFDPKTSLFSLEVQYSLGDGDKPLDPNQDQRPEDSRLEAARMFQRSIKHNVVDEEIFDTEASAQ